MREALATWSKHNCQQNVGGINAWGDKFKIFVTVQFLQDKIQRTLAKAESAVQGGQLLPYAQKFYAVRAWMQKLIRSILDKSNRQTDQRWDADCQNLVNNARAFTQNIPVNPPQSEAGICPTTYSRLIQRNHRLSDYDCDVPDRIPVPQSGTQDPGGST